MDNNHTQLVTEMLSGSEVALGRLISVVEKGESDTPEIIKAISSRLGKAFCLGITGFSGVGKSTLIDGVASIARSKGLSIGIIAVDPTSPLSGGALLGDRIRMQRHYLDGGVFIRSMATRGSYGGLSRATLNTVNLMDAFGKDLIIVETIGIGQIDVDIRQIADTVVLIMVSETGDTIQFLKSGVMEIADIVVVNKAEPGRADKIVSELENALSLSPREEMWQVPVLTTQAIDGVGIKELYEEIEKHRSFLSSTGHLSRRSRS